MRRKLPRPKRRRASSSSNLLYLPQFFPSLANPSPSVRVVWLHEATSPATTLHYVHRGFDQHKKSFKAAVDHPHAHAIILVHCFIVIQFDYQSSSIV
jgi:predicted Na+-dependent transporter